MKWSYFIGAAAMAIYFLWSAGAPTPAIVMGTGLAALWQWRRKT